MYFDDECLTKYLGTTEYLGVVLFSCEQKDGWTIRGQNMRREFIYVQNILWMKRPESANYWVDY